MKLVVPAATLLLVAAAVFTACGASRDADVQAAAVSPGGTRIELFVDTCNANLSSRVEETEQEVRVLVTARNEGNGDCADVHKISLSEPLGDRILIDESDGEPVLIR